MITRFQFFKITDLYLIIPLQPGFEKFEAILPFKLAFSYILMWLR